MCHRQNQRVPKTYSARASAGLPQAPLVILTVNAQAQAPGGIHFSEIYTNLRQQRAAAAPFY